MNDKLFGALRQSPARNNWRLQTGKNQRRFLPNLNPAVCDPICLQNTAPEKSAASYLCRLDLVPVNRLFDIDSRQIFVDRFRILLRRASVENQNAIIALDRSFLQQNIQR